MNSTVKTNESITPAVHLEFIQNQLESGGASGEEIERYHRALFLHHHALELENHRQSVRVHEDRLGFLEARLKQTQLSLSERPRLVPVSIEGQEDVRPTAPWNAWDVLMFSTGVLGIIALIAFGVLNVSFNLLESGFVSFRENPLRSYLWAALLPVGALAVKIGWDFLQERRHRAIYLWSCLALGLLGVLVWAAAYACVYPTLSKGIDEQIAGLTVFDAGSKGPSAGSHPNFVGAKWVDVITVSGQVVAEIFLSAVIGMYLTTLYARHRPVRLVQDPEYAQLDQERRELQESIAKERLGLGNANGNLTRLDNQLTALIAYGKSIFHRESARRQNQAEKRQVILDQLSENLRQHLESNESANRLTGVTVGSESNGNGGTPSRR